MNEDTSSDARMIRHSLLLAVIMGTANVANILFHMAMGRMMTAADYGVLMAMYGILYVLNVPAETLRTSMAYYAARFQADGAESDLAPRMYHQATRRLIMLTIPLVLVLGVSAPLLTGFFHLEGPGPVLSTALVCFVSIMMTTLHGILQGGQHFGWYGISMMLWFGCRLVLAIVLVWLGFRATGALTGMMLGALIALVVPYVFLRKSLLRREVAERVNSRPIYRYVAKTLVAYGAFMFLGNVDVMAAKHYFAPAEAGLFSQGALLAHFVWLIPLPIVMAMFPKAVEARRKQGGAGLLLLKALAMCALAVGALCVFLAAFAPGLLHILFDQPDHPMAPHMARYLVAVVPLALVYVFFNFEISAERFHVCVPMIAGVVVVVGALVRWHESPAQLIGVLGWVNGLTLAAVAITSIALELASKRKPACG